ncbi:unnamed protein product [Adineta steineri]|uniref:NHL repeat containing protein n=1 Tax=Adineta steineri TaxID=433720 RepID=A0A815XFX8_9BILA|nr:unnamed protein product [Adineta steineri]CAF1663420.1 unnamed protein product [Adineta steineri]
MAMIDNKTLCFKCNKNKITYPCEGCSQYFCLMDLTEHRQILNDELNHIINDYDQFKTRFNEQKPNSDDLSLINQINQWEINSIEKIKQKAKDCMEIVIECSQTFLNDIEREFNDLNEQIQKENEFNEINLEYLRNQLMKMTQELNHPSSISIQQNLQPFINDISIILSKNKKKNIFIADSYNHRIVEWKCDAEEGQIITGGNGQGNRIDQLNRPADVIVDQQNHSIIIVDSLNRRVIQLLNQNAQILIDNIICLGLTMDKYGFLYVSDFWNNEVRRWKMGEYNNEGIIVAGGNGRGNQHNQLDRPTSIFVDDDQSVYVSDLLNHRVMKWRKDAKEGRIVAGGNGQGRNLSQLSGPRGVIVHDLGQIYVADSGNDRVMLWCEGNEEGEIVVRGNGQGNQSNQLNHPSGLFFDDERNLYVADELNHRIEKFEIIL